MKIGAVGVRNYYSLHDNNVKTQRNTSFQGGINNKVLRNTGLILSSVALLSFASCFNKQGNSAKTENSIEKNDVFSLSNNTDNQSRIQKSYHYFPHDDGVIKSNSYDWVEIKYPDGTIEKDSFNYKIHITPDGHRTETKTTEDDRGNVCITTTYPDKSRTEKITYKTTEQNELIYTEKKFRPDNTLSEICYYNAYPSDSTDANSKKIIEESHHYYNEKGILIKWDSGIIDKERNSSYNKYDRQKRLIYDDIKNEKYQYKGNSKVPYRSTSICDDCIRVTLYNNDGTVKKIYFKASDGTITEELMVYEN